MRYESATAVILIGGDDGAPWDADANAIKKDFGPRLGLAYRLGSKTVVRSGYGIAVDPDSMRNQRNTYPSTVISTYAPPNTYRFVSYVGVATSDGAAAGIAHGWHSATRFPDIKSGIFKPFATPSSNTYLPTITIATFPANFDRGYYQSWNTFVQHEFSSTWLPRRDTPARTASISTRLSTRTRPLQIPAPREGSIPTCKAT